MHKHTHLHVRTRSKLDEVALAVTESTIPYGYGPWLQMSPEGLEFIMVSRSDNLCWKDQYASKRDSKPFKRACGSLSCTSLGEPHKKETVCVCVCVCVCLCV
jgi:hypothetical protein